MDGGLVGPSTLVGWAHSSPFAHLRLASFGSHRERGLSLRHPSLWSDENRLLRLLARDYGRSRVPGQDLSHDDYSDFRILPVHVVAEAAAAASETATNRACGAALRQIGAALHDAIEEIHGD